MGFVLVELKTKLLAYPDLPKVVVLFFVLKIEKHFKCMSVF